MSAAGRVKRYLVFSYEQYYPCGGWSDLEDSFSSLEDAKALCRTIEAGHWRSTELIDLHTGEEISDYQPRL